SGPGNRQNQQRKSAGGSVYPGEWRARGGRPSGESILGNDPEFSAVRNGHPVVQVVHDPVEGRQVNGFHDAHVVNWHVQILLSKGLQLATDKAGTAKREQAAPVGPVDAPE